MRPLHDRQPGVHEFLTPLATSAELFVAMLKLSSLVEAGATPLRLFVGQHLMNAQEAFHWRPRARHETLQRYVNEVTLHIGPFGIIANYVQELSEVIGARIRDFVHSNGISRGTVRIDAFIGSYRQSFFGLHKDDEHVFTFPVCGKKLYLVWPFETFAHLPAARPDAPYSHAADLPYENERAKAVVLAPNEAQYAYWPASHWHIAETSETVHASIGIGVKL